MFDFQKIANFSFKKESVWMLILYLFPFALGILIGLIFMFIKQFD